MMATTHVVVEQYLRRLKDAARSLPRQPREQLISEIREHLALAISADATEADVRNVLDDLGEPEDIVAAARPGDAAPITRGPREIFAVILLLTGFPPFLGWIVGLGLLLWSPLWTARQKLLGALVWPGGYMVTLVGAGIVMAAPGARTTCVSVTPVRAFGTTATSLGRITRSCTTSGSGAPWVVVGLILAFVPPLIVAVYLYRAAGRNAVNA